MNRLLLISLAYGIEGNIWIAPTPLGAIYGTTWSCLPGGISPMNFDLKGYDTGISNFIIYLPACSSERIYLPVHRKQDYTNSSLCIEDSYGVVYMVCLELVNTN